jgi:hypothetical protein
MTPRQAVERLLFEGIDRSPLRSLPLKSDKIADPWVLGDNAGAARAAATQRGALTNRPSNHIL